MSRGFVKDGDQEEVPVVTPRAFLPKGVQNYVTPEGLHALNQEKVDLLKERENLTGNETDRRISYNYINAKLELLEERIKSAIVLKEPPKGTPKGTVAFGSYITIRHNEIDGHKSHTSLPREQTLRITGADEADPVKGFISYFSPLAKALYGHRRGEGITINLPSGTQSITILEVTSSEAAHAANTEPLPAPTFAASAAPATNVTSPAAATHAASPTSPIHPVSPAPAAHAANIPVPETSTTETAPSQPLPVPSDDPNEIFPLVNERGITIGRAPRWQCHNGSKLLHPVVHLHVFNSQGDLYLQKRPSWKDIQPDRWDTSVGGHMKFGETPETALKREAKEELGITDFTPKFLKKYIFESDREKEYVHIYTTIYDGPITPSSELAGGRFWTREEIKENKGRKLFTPNFEAEYHSLPAASFRP